MTKTLHKIYDYLIWGIVAISLLGTALHFLFNLTNGFILFSIFSPVNESPWEHLKLLFFPALFWWIFSYLILRKKYDINLTKWIFALSISVIIGLFFIIGTHYLFKEGFKVKFTLIDVSIYFLSVIITQALGFHLYRYTKINKLLFFIALILLLTTTIILIVFTFMPPKAPIFLDPKTNTYGLTR